MNEALLPIVLLQKKAREEERAALLQKAEVELGTRRSKREQAESSLAALLQQKPTIVTGRQRLQELQRAEAFARKEETAKRALSQLQRDEDAAQRSLSEARALFTEAAQDRKAIELLIEAEQKRQEKLREKKQEEEREESWRTARAQQTGEK